MARPAKSVNVQNKHLSSAEEEARSFVENAVKGNGGLPNPPRHLSKEQKKIFRFIVGQLEASGILGTLDSYILTVCAVAIDRLTHIESMINEDVSLLKNDKLMASKDKYTKDLYRCCNELCLSPQSRAKIGSLAAQAAREKEDPLMKVLASFDD